MFLSEDTSTQLVRFGASLPAICEGFAGHTAGCGVGIGIGIGIVGSLINLLAIKLAKTSNKWPKPTCK
jgi:hypothetical protein